MTIPPRFLSCDWGTSSFRLRLVDARERRVLDEIREDAGVKAMQAGLGERPSQETRAAAFARHLRTRASVLCDRNGMALESAWIVVSGMASSTVGWRELPYATVPVPLDGGGLIAAELTPDETGMGSARVWLVSGLRTETDIMRGEECEVLGLLGGADPNLPGLGILVLPGSHSKHVRFEKGAVIDFQTYMTGELLEVLSTHSLLRLSVTWPLVEANPEGEGAFIEGVRDARDSGALAGFFQVRTRTVLQRIPPDVNAWYLAGLIVGGEALDLVNQSSGLPILLAGSHRFSRIYELAMKTLGVAGPLHVVPASQVELAVVHAHARLLEQWASRMPGAGRTA